MKQPLRQRVMDYASNMYESVRSRVSNEKGCLYMDLGEAILVGVVVIGLYAAYQHVSQGPRDDCAASQREAFSHGFDWGQTFHRLDKNRDGAIDAKEWSGTPKEFSRLDGERKQHWDGYITMDDLVGK